MWGDDTLSNARNLDVYVAKLRGYLEKDEQIEIITLRSIGYQFNVG
ncbi:MAG: helix-turn-helix domain-containing protein [Bacteroidota bacterium]